MNSRKIIIGVVLFCFMFVSCIERGDEAQSRVDGKKVLCIVKTLDNPYFSEMVEGFKSAKEKSDLNYTLVIRSGSSEGDVDTQRRVMENFYTEEVAGRKNPNILALILTPASSGSALIPVIKKYRDSMVPVVIVDTPLNAESLSKYGVEITSFIASSNFQGGARAASELLKFLSNGGDVLLLNGLDGHETARLRRDGFMSEIKKSNQKNIKVTERACDWDRNKAREVVDALLSEGNRYDAIFAANDQMAIGALQAVRQHQIYPKELPIVGFDAIREAKNLVDDGDLWATMEQNPKEMGERSIEIVNSVIGGGGVKKRELIEVIPYKR